MVIQSFYRIFFFTKKGLDKIKIKFIKPLKLLSAIIFAMICNYLKFKFHKSKLC